MSDRTNLIAILRLVREVGGPAVRRLAERLMAHVPPKLLPPKFLLSKRLPARPVPPKGSPAILPGLDTRPAPMRPVRPPAAVNDNPLAALQVEVERDLRARGYLR